MNEYKNYFTFTSDYKLLMFNIRWIDVAQKAHVVT